MKQSLIILLLSGLLVSCAHHELEAPCTFNDRGHCGPKLTLEKVIV